MLLQLLPDVIYFRSKSDEDQFLCPNVCTVVNIYGDGRCLFRCLAVFLHPELQDAERDALGRASHSADKTETEHANTLRKTIVGIIIENEALLSSVASDLQFLLDESQGQSFATIRDRIEFMSYDEEMYAGFLEVLAAAFFLQTQIRVYVKETCTHPYKLYAKLPTYHFHSRQPMNLLYTKDTGGQNGHFRLLLVKNLEKPTAQSTAVDNSADRNVKFADVLKQFIKIGAGLLFCFFFFFFFFFLLHV